MDNESDYEIKFHLYDGNEKNLDELISEYNQIKDSQRVEGSVMSKVLSYFFEGLVELLEADKLFWQSNYREAFAKYSASDKMISRFSNSRNVEVRLDKLAQRLIHRVNGLQNMMEGLQMDNPKIKVEKFELALTNFNSEVSLANEMQETMSSYAAFARASFAEAMFLVEETKSMEEVGSGIAKRKLMTARASIRQSAFIDPRFIDFVYDVEDVLDDLTKNRILIKAEFFGDQATVKSESGDYTDAKEDFKRASLFYKRASTLASDTSTRRYLLSSATIYEASELEAEGNHLFRRENETSLASEKFSDAAQQVDKAIALMGRFGSKDLESNFTSQRDYYHAMSLQTKAISLFDAESYQEAKSTFQEALVLFTSIQEIAKTGDNEVLITLSEEAKGDINGYISMCDAMS